MIDYKIASTASPEHIRAVEEYFAQHLQGADNAKPVTRVMHDLYGLALKDRAYIDQLMVFGDVLKKSLINEIIIGSEIYEAGPEQAQLVENAVTNAKRELDSALNKRERFYQKWGWGIDGAGTERESV